jgi:hypothetical protein
MGVVLTLLLTVSSVTLGASSIAFGANANQGPFTPLLIAPVHSSSVVYVLATNGCSRPSCLRLVRTTSSTSTFTTVSPPPLKALKGTPDFNLDSMQFANVDDGYATVGEQNPLALYVTRDGAKSWHQVTIQKRATIFGLTVTTHSLYAITGLCSPNGDTCHDYRIARATLDAEHWLSWKLPGSSPYNGTGWGFFGKPGAYGSDVWISEQPRGSAVLYYSRNGGQSFTKFTSSNLASVAGCTLTAESARALWAECPTGMQESFAHSNNGGASWSPVSQHQFFGTGGGKFDPVSSSLAYLDYGGTGPLVRFSDAARVTTTVGVLSCSTTNSSIAGLIFTSMSDGVALCQPEDDAVTGHLEKTSDGGRTWKRVTIVLVHGEG